MTKYFTILLAILFALTILGAGQAQAQKFQTGTCGEPICNPAPDLFSTSFCPVTPCTVQQITASIVKLLLGLSGLVAMGFIVFGGFQIVTARGNEDAVKNGRKTLTNAIIGLVIMLFSYLIVSIIVNATFGRVR